MATILLVENSTDLEELFVTLFTLQGHSALTANDLKDALNKFQQCDLALINVNLNRDDGKEICREIKNLSHLKDVPVILMSSNKFLLKNYQECGASDILEKPFEIKHLNEVIERNLTR